MKLIIFLTTFIFANALFAQTVLSNANSKNIYVYNNLKDTITLSKTNAGRICYCDTLKIVDTIQIDGVGSKEIVFFRKCNGFTEEHGGTFDISEATTISKYEIWNLDTKQMIFEATNFYHCDFKEFQAYKKHRQTQGVESYSYNFRIDSVGQITINNLKTSTEAYEVKWKTINKKGESENIVEDLPYENYIYPDKIEGTYRYKNGKYICE